MAPSTTPGLIWASSFGLGGGVLDNPAVAPNADDRLSVFVRGGGSDLYVKSQKRDWSWEADWTFVAGTAGTVAGSPVALRGPDGIINVFWRGPDGSIWTMRQTLINSGYHPILKIASGAASDPAAALNADGRVSVFYNGTDSAVWHVAQQNVDYWAWDPQLSLLGNTGANNRWAPTVARGGDGRLQVFVNSTEGEVWGRSQNQPDSTTSWGSYFRISEATAGVVGSPSAATDADQRIRVFWRAGTTGYYALQRAGYGSTYDSPGTTQGTIVDTPVAILAMDGRLEDFVIATNRSLFVCEQTKVNVSDFADAALLGGNLPGLPVPAKFHDNRIAVFHRGSDNAIWAFQQVFA